MLRSNKCSYGQSDLWTVKSLLGESGWSTGGAVKTPGSSSTSLPEHPNEVWSSPPTQRSLEHKRPALSQVAEANKPNVASRSPFLLNLVALK